MKNYYIEAQTIHVRYICIMRNYRGEQFIIELKIWHDNEYNQRGKKQLMDYLEYYHKDKGYMFRNCQKKLVNLMPYKCSAAKKISQA